MKHLLLLLILSLSINIKAQQVPNLKEKNNKYALLNQNNQVISDYYSAIYDFEYGIAKVRQETKFGAINKTGKIVIPIIFDTQEIHNEYSTYLKKYIKKNPNEPKIARSLQFSEEIIRVKEETIRVKEEDIRAKEEKERARKERIRLEEERERTEENILITDRFFDDGEYDLAIVRYMSILRSTGTNYYIYKKLAYSYNAIGTYDSAVVYFEKVLENEEDENIIYSLACAYANIAAYDQSLKYFDKLKSRHLPVKEGKAKTYHKMGEHQKAYSLQKELSESNPDNYDNWCNLSLYALFVNKPKEAIDAAKKALNLNPGAKRIYKNLVLGYVLNNEFIEAKPIYLEWKDKHFPEDGRFCKEVFLADIKELEAAGIKHKDFKKVKKLLEQ